MMVAAFALPAVLLAVLGWLVPRLVARMLPEGVRPLMLNAGLSTVLMAMLGAVFFAGLYAVQGMPLASLTEAGLLAALVHFGRLSVSAALIWAPIMILSLANLPRRWVRETW